MTIESAHSEGRATSGTYVVETTALPESRPPGARATGPAWAESLLETVIEAVWQRKADSAARLGEFISEASPERALELWLGLLPAGARPRSRAAMLSQLDCLVAALDRLLNEQLNAILHHERFQRLEASWRGLAYLVEQAEDSARVKIRILTISWRMLARDLLRAYDFDQSQLFQKVYSQEFGMPGGEPFGMLLGDYEIRHRARDGSAVDDVRVLGEISRVAAAAFAPFVAGAHPSLLELDRFTELDQPLNLSKTFSHLDYLKWNVFRETEDARFVGLTLPRIVMRPPYADDGSRVDRFCFREEVGNPEQNGYLWGNAAYAFAAVVIRAFNESGWLAGIRGFEQGREGGGVVPRLPVHYFETDRAGVAPKCSTEVMISDEMEPELGELGLIPLCHLPDTEDSVFYSNQSVQKPKIYDNPVATTNARISSMLQYMFCVSRIAHYLKVIARDKIGTFGSGEECESYLHKWLQRYVTDADASPEVKAEYPLREASVQIREVEGEPGHYRCIAYLWPHFELDDLVSAIRVTTELSPAQPAGPPI